MSWQLVARKDFEDVIRSWLLWSIVGVFVLMMGIVALSTSGEDFDETGIELLFDLFNLLGTQLLIPVTALILGYMAITAERQSGSLRILFGLSHSRRDVLLGKLGSRSVAMVVATLIVCAVVGLMAVPMVDSFPVGSYVWFLGLTVLLGLAFVGIAVGISAATGSRAKAMGGAIGSFVVFALLWRPLLAGIYYVTNGSLPGFEAPNWYLFLASLEPMTAHRHALGLVTEEYYWPMFGWTNMVEDHPEDAPVDEGLLLGNRVAGETPFYLSEWFGALVLLVWFVVPVAIGYWVFERSDLN